MENLLTSLVPLAAAMALGWVVLHPGIHEGLVVKCGLILMVFGLLGVAGAEFHGLPFVRNAAFAVSTGVLVSCLGAALRYAKWRRARS